MKRMLVSRPLVVSLLVLVMGALLLPIARGAWGRESLAAKTLPYKVHVDAKDSRPLFVWAEGDNIRRKAQAQERARALAGELVGSVLDIQMRQLEENGL